MPLQTFNLQKKIIGSDTQAPGNCNNCGKVELMTVDTRVLDLGLDFLGEGIPMGQQ